jgi:cell shape-determining protein MreC
LLNEGRTIGIAQGTRGRLINLSFIPHGEQVEVNDLVVTSGLEDGVPSGLLIGIVNTVETDPNLPFQEAVVEPLIDIGRYRIVSVLIENTL